MSPFDRFIDELGTGKPTLDTFARMAGLDALPRVETKPVRVGRADVWPPEVMAEIQRIYAEEEDNGDAK